MEKITYEQTSAHMEWRRKIGIEMRDLARRLFDLRDQFYQGRGFHWNLERKFGHLMFKVNDFEGLLTLSDLIAEPMAYTELVKEIERAEWSVAHPGRNPKEMENTDNE